MKEIVDYLLGPCTGTPGSNLLAAKFKLIGIETAGVGRILAANGMATGLIPEIPYRPEHS